MFWIIVLALVVWAIVALSKSSAKRTAAENTLNQDLAPAYISRFQQMMAEEYPDIADQFTKTRCMKAYQAGLDTMLRHTGGKTFADAAQRMQWMSKKKLSALEEESNRASWETFPEDLRRNIEERPGGYDHFIKTTETAAQFALSDLKI